MPSDRPILFSAPMVRAILDGRKTQTRRPIKPQPATDDGDGWVYRSAIKEWWEAPPGRWQWRRGLSPHGECRCPFGTVGDVLWVRETHRSWSLSGAGHPVRTEYRADGATRDDYHTDRKWITKTRRDGELAWVPSIFTRPWQARIWLRVTDVRVQRVQDISEADAVAEGFGSWTEDHGHDYPPALACWETWDDIYSKRPGLAWADDPWVWAVSFDVLSTTGRPADLDTPDAD